MRSIVTSNNESRCRLIWPTLYIPYERYHFFGPPCRSIAGHAAMLQRLGDAEVFSFVSFPRNQLHQISV